MSLFIGNIANAVPAKELEEKFRTFGKCEINYKGAFAFAEFEDEKAAENAKNELNNQEVCGQKLNIEWSRKSSKYEGKMRSDISPRGKCYNCGRPGHYARDCPRRRRSSSRKRYHSRRRYRDSRSGSRSHHHRKRYSRYSESPRSRSGRKYRSHRHRRRKSSGSYSRRSRDNSRRSRDKMSRGSSRRSNVKSESSYDKLSNKREDIKDIKKEDMQNSSFMNQDDKGNNNM